MLQYLLFPIKGFLHHKNTTYRNWLHILNPHPFLEKTKDALPPQQTTNSGFAAMVDFEYIPFFKNVILWKSFSIPVFFYDLCCTFSIVHLSENCFFSMRFCCDFPLLSCLNSLFTGIFRGSSMSFHCHVDFLPRAPEQDLRSQLDHAIPVDAEETVQGHIDDPESEGQKVHLGIGWWWMMMDDDGWWWMMGQFARNSHICNVWWEKHW